MLAAFAGSSAYAGISGDMSYQAFVVNVNTVAGGQGSAIITLDDGFYDEKAGVFTYAGEGLQVVDTFDGSVLATFQSINLHYELGLASSGPAGTTPAFVNLDFAVIAGGVDTTFTITSALLSFTPGISPAEARTSAGVTVTDVNGDGATLSGLHAGGGSFLAAYNGLGGFGSSFAELIPELSAAGSGSNSTSESFPGGGLYAPIGVPVDDMSSQWNFGLTAGDIATGTSTFEVIPTPAGLAILGAGLLLGRRRRR